MDSPIEFVLCRHEQSAAFMADIGFLPAEIDQHYPVMVDVLADSADALCQINEEFNGRHIDLLLFFDIGKWTKLRLTIADAGFFMNVQELGTAARLGCNTVTMVWLDGEYGLIKWKQQNQFDGRHSDLAFNNPDFDHLAKAWSIWGKVIDGPGQIVAALEEAFAQDGPALIAVPVDYSENVKLTKRLGEIEVSI